MKSFRKIRFLKKNLSGHSNGWVGNNNIAWNRVNESYFEDRCIKSTYKKCTYCTQNNFTASFLKNQITVLILQEKTEKHLL